VRAPRGGIGLRSEEEGDVVWSYGVAFKGANLLKILMVRAASMLAVCLADSRRDDGHGGGSLPPAERQDRYIWGVSEKRPFHEIYAVNPDGSSLTQLTNDSGVNDRGEDPAWSPDGTKMAFGDGSHVSVMDAYGSNKRNLPAPNGPPAHVTNPTWSPDGTQSAFSSELLSPQIAYADIYTISTDGPGLTNLTNSPGVGELSPDFSPNGTQMCFTGCDIEIGTRIYIHELRWFQSHPLGR
jgi:dipeptidyl aminopeptidase/acylaminoacyl peptidase